MNRNSVIAAFFLITTAATAQELSTKPNWYNLDYQTDGVRGMSTEKAYSELLKGRKSTPVIVGVIDSGIDIEHEDLKNVIWVNTKEIAGNGIDDDKNGFVDDTHGWDFLGGKDGKDVDQATLESTRLFVKYEKLFGENPKKKVLKKNKEAYNDYKKIKKEIADKREEAQKYLPMYEGMYNNFKSSAETLKSHLGVGELKRSEVEAIDESAATMDVRKAKQFWLRLVGMGATENDIKEGVDHFRDQLDYNYNTSFDERSIVGDNPSKLEYGLYGNNEVEGPSALHGTHVAGIIGAQRGNGLGIEGVADNVKILVVRAVPNGDERDKDVANAIRYAADNGAQVINMSFGKAYSPEKNWVDDAVKYAQEKGVLFVAAAGNENANTDVNIHFPCDDYLKNGKAENWISVGAMSYKDGEDMVAEFSNYGQKNVDVFAPGVAIYSSVPGSRYEEKQGTSMASPAVAGVAALLRSYFPSLTAAQVKEVIMSSVTNLADENVKLPGDDKLVKFGTLCVSGGEVNVYNAVKKAIELTGSN